MDKWFDPTLYWACDYLSMLGLKLTHVSKRGYWAQLGVVWRLKCLEKISKSPTTGTPIARSWGWDMGYILWVKTSSSNVSVQKRATARHDSTRFTWWHHQISNGNITALLAICAGNSPVPGDFPAQRPVTRIFDVFFDLRLNKPLSKQSRGWWFETPSHPLWCHRNGQLTTIDSPRQSFS